MSSVFYSSSVISYYVQGQPLTKINLFRNIWGKISNCPICGEFFLYFDYCRYLLLLDSIRQCEGVAQLLQSSQGKEVSVKPTKNNKISPAGRSSPYAVNIEKEDKANVVIVMALLCVRVDRDGTDG